MTEHWTVAYKAELATMTQAEWEADLAQFAEHLVQWETGKPLTLSGMSKSMRDRGRAVKAEAIRRGQPERIPAVFVADIPEEKEKAASLRLPSPTIRQWNNTSRTCLTCSIRRG